MKDKKYIENQMRNLDISADSRAWEIILGNAIEASELMTKKELKKYIQELAESLPVSYF